MPASPALVRSGFERASLRVRYGFVVASFALKMGSFFESQPFNSSTCVASFPFFMLRRRRRAARSAQGDRLRHSANATSRRIGLTG